MRPQTDGSLKTNSHCCLFGLFKFLHVGCVRMVSKKQSVHLRTFHLRYCGFDKLAISQTPSNAIKRCRTTGVYLLFPAKFGLTNRLFSSCSLFQEPPFRLVGKDVAIAFRPEVVSKHAMGQRFARFALLP